MSIVRAVLGMVLAAVAAIVIPIVTRGLGREYSGLTKVLWIAVLALFVVSAITLAVTIVLQLRISGRRQNLVTPRERRPNDS